MKRQTIGILLLAVPIPLIILVLSVYAITSFVIASIMATSGGASSVTLFIGGAFNVLLGLAGLVGIVGIPFGMPVGIYLLCTPEKKKE